MEDGNALRRVGIGEHHTMKKVDALNYVGRAWTVRILR